MAAARELMTAYLSLELLSFSLYILVSFAKFDKRSNEAGLKYLLLGAFSSAMFLYGLSLIYGVTGSTYYSDIATALGHGTHNYSFALLMALVLIIAGLGFKVAAVPFHMWTPDAYEGAPIAITAYLSTTSKAAGFALLLRLFGGAFQGVHDDWSWMIAGIAAASMILGNLVALQQHNIKRLMAYSSIGQIGYLLMGIAGLSHNTASALVLHLTGYIVTNLAIFVVIIAWYNTDGERGDRGLPRHARAGAAARRRARGRAVLARRAAAVRRLRDEVHPLPGGDGAGLLLARRHRRRHERHLAVLLPAGDARGVRQPAGRGRAQARRCRT